MKTRGMTTAKFSKILDDTVHVKIGNSKSDLDVFRALSWGDRSPLDKLMEENVSLATTIGENEVVACSLRLVYGGYNVRVQLARG